MFLPSKGLNRDQTPNFRDYRGSYIISFNKNTDESSYLLPKKSKEKAPISSYFELYQLLKSRIAKLHIAADNLANLQIASLRETFCDSDALINQVTAETNCINNEIKDISKKIDLFSPKRVFASDDISKIMDNLRDTLIILLNEFRKKYNISQQSYFVNCSKKNSGMIFAEVHSDTEFTGFDNLPAPQLSTQQNQQLDEEIHQLAQRAAAVKEIFIELHNIIESQNEPIARIDACIEKSLENAIEAHSQVEKAQEYQKKPRMWICVIMLLILLIILMVMALLKHLNKNR